jgi:hypothetical protein
MEDTSTVTPSWSAPDGSGDRKAMLFCPDCEHANPIDGDWVVRTVAGHRRVRCPDCRTVVDERCVTDCQPIHAD